MTKQQRSILGVGLAVSLAIGVWKLLAGPPGVPVTTRLHLGDRQLWAIARSTRVETFRLGLSWQAKPGAAKIGKYPIVNVGKEQNQKFAAQLAPALLKVMSADYPSTTCIPNPGVAFRLWDHKEYIDVIVCFNCSMLAVISEKRRSPLRTEDWRSFSDFGVADAAWLRPTFVKLAKEAFPNDKVVQRLKEDRGDFSEPI